MKRKRTARKSRRRTRRRFNITKRSRGSRPRSQTHSYKRMASVVTVNGNATYTPFLPTGLNIKLSDVINSSEFTTLYDQYRINMVVVKLWMRIDPSAQTASTSNYPKVYWFRDLDDSGSLTSINDARENAYAKVAVLRPDRPVVIKFKPNVLQLIYNGVTSTYKPAFKQWIDCTTAGVEHYGVKWTVDDFTNLNYRLDIEKTVYFQCRQPR